MGTICHDNRNNAIITLFSTKAFNWSQNDCLGLLFKKEEKYAMNFFRKRNNVTMTM